MTIFSISFKVQEKGPRAWQKSGTSFIMSPRTCGPGIESIQTFLINLNYSERHNSWNRAGWSLFIRGACIFFYLSKSPLCTEFVILLFRKSSFGLVSCGNQHILYVKLVPRCAFSYLINVWTVTMKWSLWRAVVCCGVGEMGMVLVVSLTLSIFHCINGTIVWTPGDGTKSMSLGAHIKSPFSAWKISRHKFNWLMKARQMVTSLIVCLL